MSRARKRRRGASTTASSKLYVDQPKARLKFLDHQTFPDTEHKGRRERQ